MTYQAIVKDGALELEKPIDLPDGTHVRVEIVSALRVPDEHLEKSVQPQEDWAAQWRAFAQRVDAAWKSPKSALEILSEMRR